MKHTKRAAAAVVAGILIFSLTSCASGSAAMMGDQKYTGGTMNESATIVMPSAPSAPAPGSGIYDYTADYYDKKPIEAPALDSSGSSVYQNSDVKLIRRASLTIQTTEFDQAVAQLDALVSQHFGYYENAEVYSGSYNNSNANRSGNYTIRVPAEQYDAFLSQAGDVGHLTRKNESTENVGEVYYDLEARLKTQRTKQERLLALLEKADTMEDIIKIESALSDVEYQIERYSSDLKRYDGLIGYATINLSLNEVYKIVDEPTQKDPLIKRMAAGAVSSFNALVDGVQNLLIWASYNVFGLLISVGVVAAGVVCGRRSIKKRRKAKLASNKTEENKEA